MQKSLFILLPIFFSFPLKEQAKFDVLFADDYQSALNYIQKNNLSFKKSAATYNHSSELLTTIVFPELMRYSMVSDLLETSALEYLYINNGSSIADFSIGRFQMKPSFVEHLETEIENNDTLKKEYISVITYTNNILNKRSQRLQRLKTLQWQLIYLNAFISVVKEKFKDLRFENPEDSLKFYAAAYNTGFHKTAEQIKKSENYSIFPYGHNYEGTQYAYADVATFFHSHLFVKKKSPKVPL